MDTRAVTVSGTVGKQTFPTTVQTLLRGVHLFRLSANAYVKIRDGNASGDVKWEQGNTVSGTSMASVVFEEPVKFTKGMHVKVLGTGAVAYLLID